MFDFPKENLLLFLHIFILLVQMEKIINIEDILLDKSLFLQNEN